MIIFGLTCCCLNLIILYIIIYKDKPNKKENLKGYIITLSQTNNSVVNDIKRFINPTITTFYNIGLFNTKITYYSVPFNKIVLCNEEIQIIIGSNDFNLFNKSINQCKSFSTCQVRLNKDLSKGYIIIPASLYDNAIIFNCEVVNYLSKETINKIKDTKF